MIPNKKRRGSGEKVSHLNYDVLENRQSFKIGLTSCAATKSQKEKDGKKLFVVYYESIKRAKNGVWFFRLFFIYFFASSK
jgi:hypothetical protein